ncbi:heavy metal translocating P-type ATPase [Mycolicibacterium komossense]|uniref:Cation-translocating P-type ATPase n=1 Tax=Mycolicibacterium komossense TaxID=1779 RepID=A0ABT3CG67_9MYCO|nr:cation-translocating P-type ATPase [Mycolicibacterium komossense]MCV7228475.1 cation-translocating P-type ATPase [Mycolicibacterium komossense]
MVDSDNDSVHEVRRIELAVSGMSCAACASRVERTLNKVPGVRASVNFATGVATIDAEPAVDSGELCELVEQAGYPASERTSLPDGLDDPESDRARSLFRRLVVAIVLFVPLADLSILFATMPGTRFPGWQWLLVVLAAPVVTWAAWPFHRVAVKNLRHGGASMETLISTGITAATLWSLYAIFWRPRAAAEPGVWHAIMGADSIYLEVAAGVTVFILAGRYFEARAKSKAGGALRALAALGAKDVSVVLADGSELRIPVSELKEQQQFVVRPGETIAADGLVVSGQAAVDMSAMTGEAQPVEAGPGSAVVGGTLALDGRLVVEAAAVGPDTQFAAMMRLVEKAQSGKADAQRLADRIAGVFVPVVFAIAAVTVAAWLLMAGDVDRAISAGLAVLVIACPCALGLATPTALMVASGRGAQLGIFLKGHQALDAVRNVDTVIFDKTGTITTGQLTMTAVSVAAGWERDDVLAAAAAVESASEHAVAIAIVRAAQPLSLSEVTGFRSAVGRGASGVVDGRQVEVGKPAWVARNREVPRELVDARHRGEASGQTVVFVSIDGVVCGSIGVADVVKDSAAAAIRELRERGLRTLMVTGDNPVAAQSIADQVGIDEVIAEVLPDGKVAVIDQLQARGRIVAMVGDGINDGPALASADLGLAIGRGTDVAIGAADIILVRQSLETVPQALALARATLHTIRVNMVWAFGYNIAAIPIAAAGLLNPLIAGGVMAFSSFFVVSNSLRLRSFARADIASGAGRLDPATGMTSMPTSVDPESEVLGRQ